MAKIHFFSFLKCCYHFHKNICSKINIESENSKKCVLLVENLCFKHKKSLPVCFFVWAYLHEVRRMRRTGWCSSRGRQLLAPKPRSGAESKLAAFEWHSWNKTVKFESDRCHYGEEPSHALTNLITHTLHVYRRRVEIIGQRN